MMNGRAPLLLTFFLLFSNLMGCSNENRQTGETDATALATIGGSPITLGEFQAFSNSIPDGMKKGGNPFAKERQVLESLIDKRLMLAEAGTLPLDEDIDFQDKLSTFNRNRLLELYAKQEVTDKVSVSDEEMEQHYRKTHRDRALRFNGIMLKSLEEAREIRQKIEAGGDFMELAKSHSLDRKSGEQGGDIGGYKLKDTVHPAIAEAIFPLKVGRVTEPIRLSFAGEPHYAIFQVSDEMSVPMAASENKIRGEIFGRKRAERYKILLDSLKEAYDPQLQPEQIRWLTQHSRQAQDDLFTAPTDWGAKAICIYRDGKISLDDFFQIAREMRAGQSELADSARVVYLLDQVFIPAHLFTAEAHAYGLNEHPGLIKRVQIKRDDLLISALRQRYVDAHVSASDAEARAFYDANPKKFTSPLTTEIVEILVPSDTLAQRIKGQLLAGDDPKPLARTYTTRPGATHHDGQLSLNTYTKAYYQDIYDVAEASEVGQIVGVVQTPEGYSVFKVVDRKREKLPYNADSQRRAIAYVKIGKSRRGYVSYVRELRKKHSVEIFENVVKDALTPIN